jgi:outer membrane autotransporter protein
MIAELNSNITSGKTSTKKNKSIIYYNHKQKKKGYIMRKLFVYLVIGSMLFVGNVPVFAVDYTWDGDTGGVWATNTNWDPEDTAPPGTGDTAIFNSAGNDHTTIDLGAGGVTVKSISFQDAPCAAYVIGSSLAQILTLSDNGSISMAGSVADYQRFDSKIILPGTYSFINNSEQDVVLRFDNDITSSVADAILTLDGTNGRELWAGSIITGIISDGDEDNTLGIVKNGTGKWTLEGRNTYSGGTIINAGVLQVREHYENLLGSGLVTINDGGTLLIGDRTKNFLALENDFSIQGTGNIGYGAIFNLDESEITGVVTLTGNTTIFSNHGALEFSNLVTGEYVLTVDGELDVAVSGTLDLGVGSVIKNGGGTLFLVSPNTYSGGTILKSGGALDIQHAGALGSGPVTIEDDSIFFIRDLEGTPLTNDFISVKGFGVASEFGAFANTHGNNTLTGTITLSGDACITSYFEGTSLTISGDIDGEHDLTLGMENIDEVIRGDGNVIVSGVINTGGGSVTKEGAGILTLSGANTYTGATTISTGTLQADHANALGTGAVNNNATLNIGLNAVDIGAGVYTQGLNSTLGLTASSSSSYGSIVSTGDADASVASTVAVTVDGYIPNAATLTVLNTGAGSNIDESLITATSTNSKVSFTPSVSAGKLILTASRAASGFASDATDGNTKAVGDVLDNVTDPTSDMTTMLNALDGLSSGDVDSALQTMEPSVDGGIVSAGNLSVGQMLQSISNHFSLARGAASGVSTGDADAKVKNTGAKAIWAKAFGTHAKQDKRKGIEGYRADVMGGALGVDFFANEKATFGISGGYAYNKIKPKKASLGNTTADSIQGSLYYSYNHEVDYLGAKALYFDLIGSFAYNMYEGKRNVTVGGINRQAKAEYDGQQYTVYGEAGYHIPAGDIDLIPLASLQYTRSHFKGYTEKGADSMNLKVSKQNYDLLEMGLGLKISSIIRNEDFDIIPSVRGKWLYDFIGDRAETTARFTGGGATFKTQGAKPPKSSFDIGTTLTFLGKNNIQIDLDYDFNVKSKYQSHNGAVTLKYKF